MKSPNRVIELTATACPRYIAMAADDVIDSDDSLETILQQLAADGSDSDVAVWDQFHSLAAVVLASGEVHRFDRPESEPAPRILEGTQS